MKSKRFFGLTLCVLIFLSIFTVFHFSAVPPVYATGSAVYEHSSTYTSTANVYTTHWFAQTFAVNSSSHTVSSVQLYIYRHGTISPSGTFTVSIRATSGNLPYSTDLTYGNMVDSGISTSANWVSFTMTPELYLGANTNYSVVVRDSSGSSSTYIVWEYDNGNPYSGGQYASSTTSGGSWSANSAYDFAFQIYGYSGGSTTAETRFYRSDTDANSQFILNTTSGVSAQDTSGTSGASSTTSYIGIRVWNGMTEITSGTPVAQASIATGTTPIIVSGTYSPPQTESVNSLNVTVYMKISTSNSTWTSQGIWEAETWNNVTLNTNTWTANYYIDRVKVSTTYYSDMYYGVTQSNITGLTWTKTYPQTAPSLMDFWINSTTTSAHVQFAFNVSDSIDLYNATFQSNATGTWTSASTVSISSTNAWANFTSTYGANNATVGFNFTTCNTNSTLIYSLVNKTLQLYSVAKPFLYLGSAISAVENAATWGANVDPYLQVVLNQEPVSYLETVIDTYATAQDWKNVLFWSAITNKLGLSWDTQQSDINAALGNFTMVGNLPLTIYNGATNPAFNVEDKWALYGYYYAAQSWALAYNSSITIKWNITAAFTQFNSSLYEALNLAYPNSQFPLYYYGNTTANGGLSRFYDESACAIDDFLIFYSLLNVTSALAVASKCWVYILAGYYSGGALISPHWDTTYNYFEYLPGEGYPGYECESSFFLKISSILRFYNQTMTNYTDVMQDIGNRFVSNEWTSAMWDIDVTASPIVTTYTVVHADNANPQTRLVNTLGAWQALNGVYSQLNSTYQTNLKDMLLGNTVTFPAWATLLTSNLFNPANNQFRQLSTQSFNSDWNATAIGETTLFMMGIEPGTTTTAFPLEELNYEYIYDMDPVSLAFNINSTTQTVTVPIAVAGTLNFLYGVSPSTYNFTQTGTYSVTFSKSWNVIISVTRTGDLPTNIIYFGIILAPIYTNYGPATLQFPINQNVEFYVNWYSYLGANLSGFFFGCNLTGSMVNETYSTNATLGWGGTNQWADGNRTKLVNFAVSTTIQYEEWTNDTAGNWTDTGPLYVFAITHSYMSITWTTSQTLTELSNDTYRITPSWSSTLSFLESLTSSYHVTPSYTIIEQYTVNGKDTYRIITQYNILLQYAEQIRSSFKSASILPENQSFLSSLHDSFKLAPSYSIIEQYTELIKSSFSGNLLTVNTQWSTALQYMMNVTAKYHTVVKMDSGDGFSAIIKSGFHVTPQLLQDFNFTLSWPYPTGPVDKGKGWTPQKPSTSGNNNGNFQTEVTGNPIFWILLIVVLALLGVSSGSRSKRKRKGATEGQERTGRGRTEGHRDEKGRTEGRERTGRGRTE